MALIRARGFRVGAILLLLILQRCGGLRRELLKRLLYEEPYEQLQALGMVSDTEGALERTFLSKAHIQAATMVHEIMADAGLNVHIDKVANVRGKLDGRNPSAPILLSGSHYDTVKDAGKFDGMLGIIAPIAALKTLLIQVAVDAGRLQEAKLLSQPHITLGNLLRPNEIAALIATPVELLAFCDEEGIRFQTTFLGSRALAGDLVGSGLLDSEDGSGISVRESLGVKPEDTTQLSGLAYKPSQVKGYVEVHMEQGPVLEALGVPLGLVSGIAGQTRLSIMISGTQGHAGTVPMNMRKDPMAAAAEIIAWVEKRCGGGSYKEVTEGFTISQDSNLMCTTGSILLWPNAFNVIPGSANFTLDIRSRKDDVWQAVSSEACAKIEQVCERRGLQCTVQQKTAVPAIHSDESLLQALQQAIVESQKSQDFKLPGNPGCASLDPSDPKAEQSCANPDTANSKPEEQLIAEYKPMRLVSGAGHDTLAMSSLTKVAMLFVRCRGGHSHSPLEYVSQRDVAAATMAMYRFFEKQLL